MTTPPASTTTPPTIFPTYLLPSLSFLSLRRHRRKSSTDTTTTTSSSTTSYLNGHTSYISCSRCHAELALTSQIISKGFTGRHGRAYLVSGPTPPTSTNGSKPMSGSKPTTALPNTHAHRPVPRHLVTGLHTVADISCALCGTVLGWKYVAAEDEAQRYKVGKFILETRRVVVGSCWENEGEGEEEVEGGGEEVVFDSGDEDECEDLFMGLWTPGLARRRRARRVGRGG